MGNISVPIGLAVGGILNNATYSSTSLNTAMKNANLQLIKANPDIDLFIALSTIFNVG